MSTMRTLRVGSLALTFGLSLVIFACGDDGKSDGTNGDGDGDPSGDGDGDPSGDGDGDPSGDGDGDPSGDGDGDPGCTLGELNCDCNGGQCLGDLECVGGTCVEGCVAGELGCECNGGQCLGDLECVGDVCMDPDCVPGELGCTCNGGQCLGGLECVGNVCEEASGDGDGDGDCPNVNEMMCDGQCIDVLADNFNCGGCGVECKLVIGLDPPLGSCLDGGCTPVWSECIPQQQGEGMSCDDICALSGNTCVDQGCYGDTVILSNSLNGCNSGGGSNHYDLNCDVVFGWQQSNAGCCCTQ